MHDTKSSKTTQVQNATNWWTISASSKLITSLQTPRYPNVRFWRIYFTGFPLFHQCWSALGSQGFFSLLAGLTFSRIPLLSHCSDFLRNSGVVCNLCLNCCKKTSEYIFSIYAHIVHGIVCKYICELLSASPEQALLHMSSVLTNDTKITL